MSDKRLAYEGLNEIQTVAYTSGFKIPCLTAGSIRKFDFDSTRFTNTVVVKTASDLADIDSTRNYMIDGVVDMGSQSITVPTGGISISGLNGARDTAKLTSSEDNFTLFVSPDGSYSFLFLTD